jgi:AraC-like DNA-binding protein
MVEATVVPQVRATALTSYCEVARFVGLDPYAMLRDAGINPEILEDPEHPIPAKQVGALLEDSARKSGCACFGLLMAETRSLSGIGPVSLLLTHQGTARDVIGAVIRYQGLLAEAVAIGIEEEDGTSIIRTDVVTGAAGPQSIELLMGIICRVVSEVASGRWHPDSAHFVHAAPSELGMHRKIFQSHLVFESEFNGFACSTASLDAPNPAADSVMARHAERFLEMLMREPSDGSVAERARRSIHLLLPSGRASLGQVGRNLGLHPRTLQRLLGREKRSFGTLLNDVRRELALRYLSSSTHSVSSIAQLTGYATPSSFTRWFCAEFGTAPATWRAEERQVH